MNPADNQFYPVALTIAGSDSGGGAGIQADLRTFSAFGVFGCSAITAVTSQNPCEVRNVAAIPTDAVLSQIETVKARFAICAVKTGMLLNEEIINKAVFALKNMDIPLIVDPVMVSTSGHRLLEDQAVEVLIKKLLPMADWITPNRGEAEILSGKKINNFDDIFETAGECAEKWKCGCILKGGHFKVSDDESCDVVAYKNRIYKLTSPFVEVDTAAHGTGCTFSAAIAAGLALGLTWQDTLKGAKVFVYGSLLDAVTVGDGIDAMYPPMKSYFEKVKLIEVK